MAQSTRSIAVNLTTNLHLAFDSDLCRLHTIWQGDSLNLWGPPYSGTKSPFICDFNGRTLYSFPQIASWYSLDKNALKSRFRGIRTESNRVWFSYDLAGEKKITVDESSIGTISTADWTLERSFHISPHSQPLRFLALAEGGARSLLTNNAVLITGTNGNIYFTATGAAVKWLPVQEEVHYLAEIITDEGTETGNPHAQIEGKETRLYLEIPPASLPQEFNITLANSLAPLHLSPGPGKSPVKVYASAPEPLKNSTDSFYTVEHFALPSDAELIITGMDWLPNGDLAICTWLGDVYIVQNLSGDPAQATYRRFARGLIEPLGLAVLNGQIYVAQKGELTRVADTNNDGEADLFECVNAAWGFSGNYHSYTFGPLVTPQNDFMIFTTGNRSRYDVPYQGFALEISADGDHLNPVCNGLRAPHGWGIYQGDIFTTDNQGNWIGTCRLNHIQPGKFYGFPSSTPAPKKEYAASEVEPPALWLPRSLSPSASGIETLNTDNFGPFKGQMIIGDFQNAILMRASLEKVNGHWQGSVFPFTKGFLSGINRLKMSRDGRLYVGGGKRTWSTAAPKDYSLDRVSFTGKQPFELRDIHATTDGFDLTFTKPLKKEDAEDSQNYLVKQFTYKYHKDYGSPEYDHSGKVGATEIKIESIRQTSPAAVHLKLTGLKTGFVTSFTLALTSSADETLWHDTAFYTLNQIPSEHASN